MRSRLAFITRSPTHIPWTSRPHSRAPTTRRRCGSARASAELASGWVGAGQIFCPVAAEWDLQLGRWRRRTSCSSGKSRTETTALLISEKPWQGEEGGGDNAGMSGKCAPKRSWAWARHHSRAALHSNRCFCKGASATTGPPPAAGCKGLHRRLVPETRVGEGGGGGSA